MSVEVTMIGTGSAFAKRYFNNNALVKVDGYQLLLDCGVTAPYALHRLDVGFTDIDALLVTHIHGDHVGGLEEFAFQMMFKYRKKPVLYVPSTIVETLWNSTLKGAMEVVEQGLDTLDAYFQVIPVEPRKPTALSEGLTVELIPTLHIPGRPSYGVLMNDTLFYSSDLVFDEALLTSMIDEGRCRHIMHDCQLIGKGEVHTTLTELLSLPPRIQERIWLMHYGDEMEQFVGQTGLMKFIEQHKPYRFE
ncbi:MBL fold metallo-hydrolase [Paenibacillus thermotolerans]|uniref:MBL fold metallo-hydrolase n=1 Tax=Paenibacillus thermotolerans TaxID=3027807 RepID=UPI00236752BC|nr:MULTISPECIES: MBL fold metallo-hydrolase [unclassified Paenibacillus]